MTRRIRAFAAPIFYCKWRVAGKLGDTIAIRLTEWWRSGMDLGVTLSWIGGDGYLLE
jgi:hypothetical protein